MSPITTAWLWSSPSSHCPHPSSSFIPCEAASVVSLVFLPLGLSSSCNEICHSETAPSLPRDVFLWLQLPLRLCIHSFIQQPLRLGSVLYLFQTLKIQPHWPSPSYSSSSERGNMAKNTKMKCSFGEKLQVRNRESLR